MRTKWWQAAGKERWDKMRRNDCSQGMKCFNIRLVCKIPCHQLQPLELAGGGINIKFWHFICCHQYWVCLFGAAQLVWYHMSHVVSFSLITFGCDIGWKLIIGMAIIYIKRNERIQVCLWIIIIRDIWSEMLWTKEVPRASYVPIRGVEIKSCGQRTRIWIFWFRYQPVV